jgi:hypothetical protein
MSSNLWYNLSQLSCFVTFSFKISKFLHTLSDSHKSNKDAKKLGNLQHEVEF